MLNHIYLDTVLCGLTQSFDIVSIFAKSISNPLRAGGPPRIPQDFAPYQINTPITGTGLTNSSGYAGSNSIKPVPSIVVPL